MNTATSSFTPRAIVVGADGSEQSIAALELAAHLVPLAGDFLRAVTAWQYPSASAPLRPSTGTPTN